MASVLVLSFNQFEGNMNLRQGKFCKQFIAWGNEVFVLGNRCECRVGCDCWEFFCGWGGKICFEFFSP